MTHSRRRATRGAIALVGVAACTEPRATPATEVPERVVAAPSATAAAPPVTSASASATVAPDAAPALALPDAARPRAVIRQIPFAPHRASYVVLPTETSAPARLLAMLHGVCVPPSYVCGGWRDTAAATGVLVCPTGNTTCGPDGTGGPTWEEPFADIDADLELAVGAAKREIAPPVTRHGAILAGFSRGAYAAVIIAVRHPGRWPFLILNEADVELSRAMMQAAGVHAVALIAGEWSAQIQGERKTAAALAAEGFPVRLWVMPKVGHAYSPDIDAIMQEAVAYVLSFEAPTRPPVP